jgi:hypothetical protein
LLKRVHPPGGNLIVSWEEKKIALKDLNVESSLTNTSCVCECARRGERLSVDAASGATISDHSPNPQEKIIVIINNDRDSSSNGVINLWGHLDPCGCS